MSTFERQPLSALSTNRLHRINSTLKGTNKPSRVEKPSIIKSDSLPITRGDSSSSLDISNADKLKYRLKLAYYKLRTNQIKKPATEIIKEENKSLVKGTPSLTRHISLLAASTPFQSQSSKKKKVVSFNEPTKSIFKITKNNNSESNVEISKIQEFQTFKPSVKLRSLSLPAPNPIAMKFNHTINNRSNLQISKPSTTVQPQNHRSLKIDDLCNVSANNTTILQDDADATINELTNNDATIINDSTINATNTTEILKDDGDITPVRRRRGISGPGSDATIGSSPSKVYMSTPGSYKAAKSLLELGLIN